MIWRIPPPLKEGAGGWMTPMSPQGGDPPQPLPQGRGNPL